MIWKPNEASFGFRFTFVFTVTNMPACELLSSPWNSKFETMNKCRVHSHFQRLRVAISSWFGRLISQTALCSEGYSAV